MLGSVSSGARVTLGKKHFLSLRFGIKRSSKEIRNSDTGCTLAMPLLQTVFVSQDGTQLPSNIQIFLVAKPENC